MDRVMGRDGDIEKRIEFGEREFAYIWQRTDFFWHARSGNLRCKNGQQSEVTLAAIAIPHHTYSSTVHSAIHLD